MAPTELPSGCVPWSLDETLVRLGDRPGAGDGLTSEPSPDAGLTTRYAPRGVLGEGGMGRVDDVLDLNLGRRVALKTLRPALVGDDENRRRFLREAQIQGQLDHPAVVPVHELGRDPDGAPWFTMRKVCGQTLADVIHQSATGPAQASERFHLRRLLVWFVQASLAIEYAHSRQVLHLDLKPSNVMVGEFGEVYVLDWGLARGEAEGQPAPSLEAALEAATGRAPISGTPGYMAPEQARGEPLDARADVYALGCILFELLALEPMHGGHTVDERLAPLPVSRRSPASRAPAREVPLELDALVVAATDPDRSLRVGSARALAEAVERYLDGDRHSESLRAEARASLDHARALTDQLAAANTEQRETTLNAVTRALALAPGHPEAHALLHRVLTSTPAEMPEAVKAAIGLHEGEARAELARAAAVRQGIWVLVTPLLWLMGPRDGVLAVVLTATVIAALGVAVLLSRRATLSASWVGALVATTALGLAGLNLLFGPFVLVPSLGAATAVLFSGHLRPRARALAIGAIVLAVLGPWCLEALGVLAPSVAFAGDQIHLLPRLVHFPAGLTTAVLVIATLSTLVTPAILSGRQRDRLAKAEGRLQLMAWYLERLGAKGRVAA